MTNRGAARRYARALLDVAVAGGDPEAVERELMEFADLLRENPALQKALLNPAVPTPRKRAVVEQILSTDGSISPIVSRLFLFLAERDRFGLFTDLVDAYRQTLQDHQQVVRAEITTARPLSEDRLRALQAKLVETTGKSVTLETRVDPELIGGVVTRIGSVVYDGSVVRQLERLKEQLIESGQV
jgi:F-type H+-transporting ATPase subunit delta